MYHVQEKILTCLLAICLGKAVIFHGFPLRRGIAFIKVFDMVPKALITAVVHRAAVIESSLKGNNDSA